MPKRSFILLLAAVVVASCASSSTSAPRGPRLRLPYDLAARGSSLYIADGERHQILRFDLKKRRTSVFAGTGRTGTSGDGGPARRARLTEPTEVTLDPDGNLYFSDVNQGRVRRIDRNGVIATVAQVPAAAGVSVDPSGRYLAIASIEGGVYRMKLPSGPLETLADGLSGPHDVSYDRAGNLYIGGPGNVRRIDAATGELVTAFELPAFKLVPVADGTLWLLSGDSSGGRITHFDAAGNVLQALGSGRIAPHSARTPLRRVSILPSDVEPAPGGILISEVQPTPSVRKLRSGAGVLTTLMR
jgi:sugar lactone lactonase YvrE